MEEGGHAASMTLSVVERKKRKTQSIYRVVLSPLHWPLAAPGFNATITMPRDVSVLNFEPAPGVLLLFFCCFCLS